MTRRNDQVDLARMVSIITTSVPWIVNIYVVQLLLMYTFSVLGKKKVSGEEGDSGREERPCAVIKRGEV